MMFIGISECKIFLVRSLPTAEFKFRDLGELLSSINGNLIDASAEPKASLRLYTLMLECFESISF